MSVSWIRVQANYKAGDEVYCTVDEAGFGFRRKYVRRVYVETEAENLEDNDLHESWVYYAVSDFPHGDFDRIDRVPEDFLYTREQALEFLAKLVRHCIGPCPQVSSPEDNRSDPPRGIPTPSETGTFTDKPRLERVT